MPKESAAKTYIPRSTVMIKHHYEYDNLPQQQQSFYAEKSSSSHGSGKGQSATTTTKRNSKDVYAVQKRNVSGGDTSSQKSTDSR